MVKQNRIAFLFATLILVASCKTASKSLDTRAHLPKNQRVEFEKHFYEALKQKALNNTDKARDLFIKSIEVYPESHASMFELGVIYYENNDVISAVRYAELAVQNSPKFNRFYSSLLAKTYSLNGDAEKSALEYEKMVIQDPESESHYLNAAQEYMDLEKYDKAIEVLRKMENKFNVSVESASALESIYTLKNDKQQAVKEIEKLIKLYPNKLEYRDYLADSYYQSGDYNQAINEWQAILAVDSNYGDAHLSLSKVYKDQGKEELAFSSLKKAFASKGIPVQVKLKNSASYFLKIKKDKKELEDFLELSDILINTHAESSQPYVLRSDIHLQTEEYQLARDYCRKAVDIDRAEFKTWSKLLYIDKLLGNKQYSLEDSKEALDLFPNAVSLYAANGYALYDLKKYDEAIQVVNDGLEIAFEKTDKIELLSCKASCLNKQKKYQLADENYYKVLRLSKNNPDFQNNYAFALAQRGERLNYADSLISKALDRNPDNAGYCDTKAWILYKLKDYSNAIIWSKKAIALNGKNEEFYTHIIEIFKEDGKVSEAKTYQDKLKNLSGQ